jgi:hypothetical protein
MTLGPKTVVAGASGDGLRAIRGNSRYDGPPPAMLAAGWGKR